MDYLPKGGFEWSRGGGEPVFSNEQSCAILSAMKRAAAPAHIDEARCARMVADLFFAGENYVYLREDMGAADFWARMGSQVTWSQPVDGKAIHALATIVLYARVKFLDMNDLWKEQVQKAKSDNTSDVFPTNNTSMDFNIANVAVNAFYNALLRTFGTKTRPAPIQVSRRSRSRSRSRSPTTSKPPIRTRSPMRRARPQSPNTITLPIRSRPD